MPIYEYSCGACGHALEALQKLSDAPLTDCPACGKAELRKLISAAGFRLKGGGWYETDFKGKKTAGAKSEGEKTKGEKTETAKDSPTAPPACGAGGCDACAAD